ncbi:MAG: TetR/AcrR family transcriptional regulator [Eggerthellaceae bacterium]|jgi:AcrR family transcriptional regulator
MQERIDPRTARVRAALMEAVRELVAERPVEDLSVTEVAAAAGTSRRVVYEHFGDLASLVAEATLQLERQILAPVIERRDGQNVRAYMSGVLSSFVEGMYAEREFCRNALHGPSAYRIATDTTRMLDETMCDHVMGKRFAPEDMAADDRRYAIAAGVVGMVIRWFESDFTGENAPDAMAQRLLDTMFSLAGVSG